MINDPELSVKQRLAEAFLTYIVENYESVDITELGEALEGAQEGVEGVYLVYTLMSMSAKDYADWELSVITEPEVGEDEY